MRQLASAIATLALVIAAAPNAQAHCQVPCGIFDDELRVATIEEHATTIEKAMVQIEALAKGTPVNFNQMVRWINTKDHHADEIQEIVAAYFMAQRIKIPADGDEAAQAKYLRQLTLLHAIQVQAMKAKHGTDVTVVAELRRLVKEFRVAYFGPEGGHAHTH